MADYVRFCEHLFKPLSEGKIFATNIVYVRYTFSKPLTFRDNYKSKRTKSAEL
jgi:hypothetical protein